MFETFSNTVENKHVEEIGTDYDVDRIRIHDYDRQIHLMIARPEISSET